MLPDIESARSEKRRRKDSQTEVQWTAKDTEDKYENCVFLVIRKALEKYESNKEEGRVKGNKKPPKDTTSIELAGAVSTGGVGALFDSIGTAASAGATVFKFGYEFIYGYFHREKAKAIVKSIEKSGIDETQILNMFASIGAEIFRVFEYQLSHLEVSDLEKVAHDVVIRVYNAIADKPNIWDKDECERSVLLAKSATEPGAILAEISRGHNVNSIEAWKSKDLLSKAGIYDDKNHFVCDNTDSLKYKFRRPFKNEEIDRKVWRLANNDQIGSFQPQYFVNEEMAARVKENAISKIKAANPTMAAKQNSKDMRNASNAVKQTRLDAQFLRSYFADLQERRKISNTQTEEVVELQKMLNGRIGNMLVKTAQETEKSGNIMKRLKAILQKYINFEKIQELSSTEFKNLEERISQIAADIKSKWVGVSNMTPRVVNYLQREGPYKEIVDFLDVPSANCNEPSIQFNLVCIVGEPFIGKTEMAKSCATIKFQDKNVFWIDATNQERIEDCIQEVAKRRKVEISEDMDSRYIWQQICLTVAQEATLMVFDNANTYPDIANYMPWHVVPNVLSPKVIVTSRNEQGWNNCKVIKLHPFSPEECLKFFKESLKVRGYYVEKPANANDKVEVLGDTDEKIIELGSILGFIPKHLNEALSSIINNWKKSGRRERKQDRYTLTKHVENLRSNQL